MNTAEYEVIKYSVYDENDQYVAQNLPKEKDAIELCKLNGKEVEAVCWVNRHDYNKGNPADNFCVIYRKEQNND